MDVREAEGGDVVERLAVALDDHRSVGLDYVAPLLAVVADVARDHVATVDRDHRLDPLARVVLEADVVALADPALDEHRPAVPVARQAPAVGALDRHRDVAADRRRRLVDRLHARPVGLCDLGRADERAAEEAGEREAEGEFADSKEASHGRAPG
ncbi:MAG: hypothetical protein H6710_09860 [Myxococcales bacterium]|nr:hypothetical protein [Myxococcales bacterium]